MFEVDEGEEAGSSTSRRGSDLRFFTGFAAQRLGLRWPRREMQREFGYPTMLLIIKHVSENERETGRGARIEIK